MIASERPGPRSVSIIGAPSSAGAYAPGQERAPTALRQAGLASALRSAGLDVIDLGDIEGFRWQPDPANPRAMNVEAVASVANKVARHVASVLDAERIALVLGGDCTVELGTVTGARRHSDSVGLVYIDLDADLNVPSNTVDGALDWMVVAHLLDVPGADGRLTGLGGATEALLKPEEVVLFGADRMTEFENEQIARYRIRHVSFDAITRSPAGAATSIINDWAARFDYLLVHLDVDVLDYVQFPIAENVRRGCGLRFEQLTDVLHTLLQAPNLSALTITEINPDHCDKAHGTIRRFVDMVAAALSGSKSGTTL